MDEHERQLLETTAALAKENNKLLKKLHHQNIYGNIIRVVRYVIFVGLAIWSYILIQPFLQQAQEVIKSVQETQQTMNELKTKAQGALTLPDVSNVNFSGLQKMLDAFTINEQ